MNWNWMSIARTTSPVIVLTTAFESEPRTPRTRGSCRARPPRARGRVELGRGAQELGEHALEARLGVGERGRVRDGLPLARELGPDRDDRLADVVGRELERGARDAAAAATTAP